MRSWKQRLWSLLLCGAMLVSPCAPAAAEEEDGTQETYIALTWDGSKLVKETPLVPVNITEITAENVEILVESLGLNEDDGGWYIVRENGVSSGYGISVDGTVHLILADGCSLDFTTIKLEENSNLSIYAQSDDENMGKLTVRSNAYNAGIEVNAGSTVTIHGGRVTATGDNGAGIGGYDQQAGGGGNITINGGTVEATSSMGAGIGGGGGGNGGTITISDGAVTATSTLGGAGIGGGIGGGGEITISGGTVKASCAAGADIGGGFDEINGSIVPSDKIEISGGTVTRPGGDPPKIGFATHEAKEDEWLSDGAHHWHPCEAADCDKNHQFNKAAHSFGEWTIDTPATSTTAGSRHRVCGDCQYQESQTIPPIEPPDPVDPPSGGGYPPPTYKPDVTQPGEGGTVSVTPSRPERGDTVTVQPKPDEGYEVDKITVTDKNGKPIEVVVKPDGTYTFQQPNGKVKIEVAYKPIEIPWSNPFADVSEDDWHYEAVQFVQERGLMNGYSDGGFGPDDALSRAQLAQILFNKEGRPAVNYLLDFSDLADGSWYTEAVRWAASQGIVGGYGDGTFAPDAPITREQLAVMLWRYSGSPASSKDLDFNDENEISPFALEALRWAVETGILNGGGDGRLAPQDQATRAQVAQMLKNFIENQEANT
jgi:hypothetical protein